MTFASPDIMIRPLAGALVLVAVMSSASASAHCDTTQGPVVTAARSALDAGDVNLVLHWVRPEDEDAIRDTFRQTLAVRALGREAGALADRHFFETLVRLHRAGEKAPYTGLSDAPPEAIIAATDRALETGSPEELEQQLVRAVRSGLAERFAAARAARGFRPGDVAGGRAFVATYVPLTHWVEGVFTIAGGSGAHHGESGPQATALHHEPADHGKAASPDASHGDRHVPWILAALFGIAASIEAWLLIRRQRRVAA